MIRRKKLRLFEGSVLLFVVFVAGFLFAASGLAPMSARGGHWAVTEWVLQFAKKRSISAHALFVEEPALDEPWLVLKGGGHFETGCRPCHGSPDLPQPRLAQAMLPPPPYLPEILDDYSNKELFYIVKHGLKLTGMPAWPSDKRDDEVRAIVAFLRAMPSLDAEKYRRLVHGEAAETRAPEPIEDLVEPAQELIRGAIIASCARCHGTDGQGRGSAAFPAIAGQKAEYLRRALTAYARGERHSGIMEPIAGGLDEEELRGLADHYSRLPARAPSAPPTEYLAASVERGRSIARDGIPDRGVPACADCHGPAPTRRNAAFPNLAGQYPDYLVLQLELFQKEHRGGSAYAHLMDHVAPRLTPPEMRDVAQYYGSISSEDRGSMSRATRSPPP
jgi:cytochrome c553